MPDRQAAGFFHAPKPPACRGLSLFSRPGVPGRRCPRYEALVGVVEPKWGSLTLDNVEFHDPFLLPLDDAFLF